MGLILSWEDSICSASLDPSGEIETVSVRTFYLNGKALCISYMYIRFFWK